jgi:hypothetical protein
MGLRRTEQLWHGEQFAQHARPAVAEGVVGDEAVLLADGGGVRGVVLGGAGQDRQVGVAQHFAVGVAGGGVVGAGEADQAGDFGRTFLGDASGRARSARRALRSSLVERSGR